MQFVKAVNKFSEHSSRLERTLNQSLTKVIQFVRGSFCSSLIYIFMITQVVPMWQIVGRMNKVALKHEFVCQISNRFRLSICQFFQAPYRIFAENQSFSGSQAICTQKDFIHFSFHNFLKNSYKKISIIASFTSSRFKSLFVVFFKKTKFGCIKKLFGSFNVGFCKYCSEVF